MTLKKYYQCLTCKYFGTLNNFIKKDYGMARKIGFFYICPVCGNSHTGKRGLGYFSLDFLKSNNYQKSSNPFTPVYTSMKNH